MNFGRGFSIHQENGFVQKRDSWTPVTPAKLIPQRSNMIPIDMPGNQVGTGSWQELLGMYTEFLHEKPDSDGAVQNFIPTDPVNQNDGNQNWDVGAAKNFIPTERVGQNGVNRNWDLGAAERNHCFNRNASSHLHRYCNDPANWDDHLLAGLLGIKKNAAFVPSVDGSQNTRIHVPNGTVIPNSRTQVGSNCAGSDSTNLMLRKQNQTSSLNQQISRYNLQQLPTDGFPVPYRPYYNLNSPPRSQADAASRTTNSIQFAPITPDQGNQLENQRFSEKLNFSVGESSSREKESHENLMVSVRSEESDSHHNKQLQNIVDSSSSAISTTLKTKKVSDEGEEQGIDLNKTPQQKMPRRRKHRPKVVIEGKPKRTPEPKAPKNKISDESPSGKRKYVRKKGVKISETQQIHGVDEVCVEEGPQNVGKRKYVWKKSLKDVETHQANAVVEVTGPAVETAAKSCRRALNFDLECEKRDESRDRTSWQQIERNQGSNDGFNLNFKPQDTEQFTSINSLFGTNRVPSGNTLLAEQSAPTPLLKGKDHALNVIARNVSTRSSIPGQNSWRSGYSHCQVNQHFHGEGISQIVFQADTASTNPERTIELLSSQITSQSLTNDMLNFNEKRGLKRLSIEQMHPRTVNAMGSPFMCQKMLWAADPNSENNFSHICSETHKKKKIQNGFHATISSAPSRQEDTRRMDGVYANRTILQSLNSYLGRDNTSERVVNAVHGTARNLQQHLFSSQVQNQTERVAQRSTQVHDVNSLTAMVNWNGLPTAPPQDPLRSNYLQEIVTCNATVLEKETAKPSSPNQRLRGIDKMLQQHHNNDLEGRQQSSTKARGGQKKQKFQVSVDIITYRLEGLHIYGESKEEEQHALVPYKGGSSIIPYEPIKKRKPRPKVDLDPETDRLWKLLMGKEESEGAEAIDTDKEKWWDEEREVFSGRADSFIARMHLVQGDRRFSRWKGSVVDSVIGVFLTQNVSDHLSSSAFMCLAAKFPLKSNTTSETCSQNGTCILVQEPDIQILEKIGRQPVYSQSCESPEHIRHLISGPRCAANEHNSISEEEVISPQDSFDSFVFQTTDEVRSSSGSNSEAEDQTMGCKPNNHPGPTPINLLQAKKARMFRGFFSHDSRTKYHQPESLEHNIHNPRLNRVNKPKSSSGFTCSINSNIQLMQESLTSSSNLQLKMMQDLRKLGVLCGGMLGAESMSSLPSTASGITEAYHAINRTYEQNEMPSFQAPTISQYEFPSKHPTHRENFQSGPQIGYSQYYINNHQQERSKAYQPERALVTEPIGPAEILAKRQTGVRGTTINTDDRISVVDKQNFFENTAAEANSKEENHSSRGPISGTGTNILKARKGKAEDDKKRAFDWDSLRKQVQQNGERREKNKDTMDSLDYETLRCAGVNEISDAIRERGMNNMLADRIKDFLDRLVKEHGSIDLEWLRDVPPDKAKDYLLSIRGLGLKSVECVRLLTLHHLAFPVDTNVGRIAVRLGWVPLQPLPESLQLHLLELYPVLESVQKYLWPRLCKLDQLTLYELHYQMITFGKVFCTKSKPNCNACPMRAECRHFASAFASARLALPGPEEKSIVSSDVPIASRRNHEVVIKPMPLPQAENNSVEDAGFFARHCEPIIEEPTSPEPEITEISQSDIEDAFYEDPEEIPTIKLNMEEFTLNLLNFMQDNMELQGDMSKALVALNPEAASIPAPKLKYVSRLRTEHQVYELPDSHPLLDGLDKREPDDPSPYLLAIWTPGETENSVQPPESTCWAQESGNLCDEKMCFSCNSVREANSQTVRGTLLIPCRTAMRGSFPLNGTYFQVNEMFADHESSLNPIDVPRAWVWNLPRRTVYFGTSVSTIFKGLTTEGIQYCFWRGFVCVRGFDQKTRAPRPLRARLHFPASKLVKTKNEGK